MSFKIGGLSFSVSLALLTAFAAQPALSAPIHSFASLTFPAADGSVDSGAGNVNNSAIGTDRQLIVEFDLELTAESDADAWFAIGFGFDSDTAANSGGTTLGFGSEPERLQSEFALLVRTLGSSTHTGWEDQDNTGLGFGGNLNGTPGNPNDGIDGKVRITIDLSAAGIANGESATVKYEVDNDANGTFDDSLTDTVDWEDGDNYVWLGSRANSTHEVTNFSITSAVPEPSTVLLALLGAVGVAIFRFRRWGRG